MDELRFDGQVAIVTGAGGNPSLGRSHARLLASRGAKVVVNDLGVGPDGLGRKPHDAQAVAQEIVDAGGEAVADLHSVAEEDSAQAVVRTALDAWGRVDVLVNNAGVAILALFDEISPGDLRRVVDVHLYGTIWMCRAVWPHMREAGGGRIVNIVSGGMLGNRYISIYGAAKGGILALTRGLAIEGREHGVSVNALGPAARTSALEHLSQQSMVDLATPAELVSPMVAYLAHPECTVSGGYFESGGGRMVFRTYAEARGFSSPSPTIEEVRDHIGEIMDLSQPTLIPEPLDNPYADIIDRKPYRPG
jgi:NAD(P)-dependent dehydrogenase (short-subunit alcohol dehydrogenase family)